MIDTHLLDDGTAIVYRATLIDESFDHEFGSHKSSDTFVEILSVTAVIDGEDVDVVSAMPQRKIESWKKMLRQKVIDQRGAA